MHIPIVLCCGAKRVLFTNKLSEYWCHTTIKPYLFTKFHTSKHLGNTNMHVHIVLCCGAKRVLFTNKLSKCWCHIINPYLFTKFHTSKHLGSRVTQTCMPYCNVWAEVVYCGFPQNKVFTKTFICPLHITKVYISTKSHMWVYSG